MRFIRGSVAGFGVLVSLCGCSGDGDGDGGAQAMASVTSAGSGADAMDAHPPFDAGGDPARNAVVPGTICARLATIQCAGEAHCCDAPGRAVEACVQAQQSICADELLADSIAGQPAAGFDAAAAESAFAELERLASTCDTGFAAFAESLAGLRGMFKGTVAAGGACNPINPLDTVMAGAALASCADAASQACLPRGITWTCTARSADRGACFTDVNCQQGLYCNNPALSLTGGSCRVRKAAGDACALVNECASLACEAGVCVEDDPQAVYCLQ